MHGGRGVLPSKNSGPPTYAGSLRGVKNIKEFWGCQHPEIPFKWGS